MQPSLGTSAARNALLGSSGQIVKLIINMASLVVLSRILTPEDYGLTALAFAIIGVAELVRDLGLSTASLQASSLSNKERNNLWWANTLLGFGCTLICCVVAPLIAYYFADQRLVLIIISMSFVFTFSGMATQYRCDLIRKLQYGRVASWEVFSSLLALLSAIFIAVAGGGYWALVAQQLISNSLTLGGLAYFAHWLPKRYDRKTSIRKFFSFGMPLFGSSILTYASGNLDTILIGSHYGNNILGSYNRAIQMVRMPMNQLRNPIGNVALSTLSKVRADPPRYARMILQAQALFLYPIVGIALWITICAPDIILILLGDKWASSISLVMLLALADAVTSLSSVAGWVYLSENKSSALFKLTIFNTLLRISLFLAAIPYGVNAIASVYILTGLIMWPLTFIHCQAVSKFNTKPMFWVSVRVFLTLGGAALGAWWAGSFLTQINQILHLLMTSLIYLGLFVLFVVLIPSARREVREVISMGQRIIHNKSVK